MPNHITNRLKFTGSKKDITQLLKGIKGKRTKDDDHHTEISIDFNKILPMPKSLNITSGSLGETAHELLFGYKPKFDFMSTEEKQRRFTALPEDKRKESVLLALQYQSNLEKYGHTTWYDWALDNWGTKWNAYDQSKISDNEIQFDTAWSAPIDLMRQLSAKYPTVEIEHTYADEDSGSNVGIITYKDGEIVNKIQPESRTEAAYDIYFSVNPSRKEDYEFDGETYQYKEEE